MRCHVWRCSASATLSLSGYLQLPTSGECLSNRGIISVVSCSFGPSLRSQARGSRLTPSLPHIATRF